MLKYAYTSLAVRTLISVLTIVRYNPSAYNINSLDAEVFRNPVHSGERGSYFGFSVALYVGADESLLLVGAPRANSSELQFVTEPGTVFQCKLNGSKDCTEWPIDKTENGPHPHESLSQIKDNAWIGATIAVQNKIEARVMVCGPRWMRNVTSGNRSGWYMNGICYSTLAINAKAFEREADERTFLLQILSNPENQIALKNDTYNYEQAQVGFSLHMNSRYAVDIAIGSPGVYDWKGHVMLTTQMNGPSLYTVIPSLAGEVDIYDYFGYAITAGSYFDEQHVCYASSAPRGAHMYGLILVFNFLLKTNQNMVIKTIVYGEQYGEYFGAALTSCDVNNDRRHELIVGAPQWSRDMDEGRVYIFTAPYSGHWNFVKLQTIEGEIIGGRFGSSVMCLGDIDHDGYGDIAVGAPYEEESGGAVYIFNGNRDGVSQKYSQRLVGSRFSPRIRGFGISISEPRDVNHDNYPDIAVGAYQSGEVVLLKSMTVVTINVTLVPHLKDPTGFFVTEYVRIQLSYKGEPECLRVGVTFKIDPIYRGAMYMNDERHKIYKTSYVLFKEKTLIPLTLKYLIEEYIQNMESPLEISAFLELDNKNDKNNCCTSCVINMFRSKTKDIIKLPFKNNTRISDLGVTLSTDNNRYVIGSEIIKLHINIYKRGGPAYQTKVRIFIEVLMLASIPPNCIEDSRIDSTLNVICDVGDLFETEKKLTLQLDMSKVKYDVKKIKLQAIISSQSNETNLDNNTHIITVRFYNDIALTFTGKTQESLYSYANEKRIPNSIRLQHFYEVQNFGDSPVEDAVLTVKIPTHIWRSDTERIAIVNVKHVTGRMDGYELFCDSHGAFPFALKNISTYTIMKKSSIANGNTYVKLSPSKSIPPENRTFYINCTSSLIHCTQFNCRLRPFLNSLSVAKFLVTLDLQRSNFPDDVMENKDIIFYVTEGCVNITQPYVAKRDGHKLNTLVATTFLGPLLTQRISAWLIAFSIFLGIVLLTLLTLCLMKVGFFDRLDLEALKETEIDVCIKIVD